MYPLIPDPPVPERPVSIVSSIKETTILPALVALRQRSGLLTHRTQKEPSNEEERTRSGQIWDHQEYPEYALDVRGQNSRLNLGRLGPGMCYGSFRSMWFPLVSYWLAGLYLGFVNRRLLGDRRNVSIITRVH